MKHIGQPKSAPQWYKQKESYIETQFLKNIGDLADAEDFIFSAIE